MADRVVAADAARATWTRVEAYLNSRLVPPHPDLEAAQAAADADGLPAISVTPNEGRLLNLLARTAGARRILEIGTLGGYSTLWLAHAVPADGRVNTLEINAGHAAVARRNIERAGLEGRVEIVVDPAMRSLERFITERVPPFDVIFIDADKENSLPYFQAALRLSRPGTLIIVDNVVRDGAVAEESSSAAVQGVQALLDWLALAPAIEATAIQTVGSKGYDGFLVARVGTSQA